jgi:hypothetical protein
MTRVFFCEVETPIDGDYASTASSCWNEARYIRRDGKRTCAIHASGQTSIRLSDIPSILRDLTIVLEELEGSPICPEELSKLREMIGLLASNVRPSR